MKLPEGFGARARLTHYRIDDTHSNAYTKWVELGNPQKPSPEMLAQLKTAMQLEMLEPARVVEIGRRVRHAGLRTPPLRPVSGHSRKARMTLKTLRTTAAWRP